ncbi:pirin family protein [Singulisphaera acidiphila]|uniref:Pirin-related protein n=1 Tax=Singulisphaera acidiphila (strain ATCC BAA-1392 / DSM 18658 / VKM B-2454 / MOB10) TaxID=886293 RepID=L0DH42_SINAD|nr:pirin family protein [Singulisphaera acidiphila]AGA27981.1 Pirin-related protein [Singulisphaera acidiphila DSM 18658]
MKTLVAVNRDADTHWVGNGFPVRTLFSPQTLGEWISPFLMLDYAGPAEFPPSDEPRGVGEHPHRGFETVTIVYQGELEHRDSAGNHGKIGPGDVQWMTAASGVVHEEWHEQAFTKQGGVLEMVQLWVNLPAKDKMSPPRYQEILSRQIPVIDLDGAGTARVIAGEFRGTKGPAQTFTPLNVWDVRLKAGHRTDLEFPAGSTALVLVLKGKAMMNGTEPADEADLAVFDREGGAVTVEAQVDSTLLVMSGEPIDEPVVSYGPFVMNTQAEIRQAISDYQSGKMGHLAAPS